ncbi:MAG: NAD/NADP octopine/nopaline dehydrogenase family protein [Syntrophaceae bacterium]|nr:NAD/NADP octopine/nopaline dehydrogenase family protein [Syntrophaceae bacterium]
MTIKKIAILGAGNGGCTFAAHLGLKGFEVTLYENPQFEKNILPIRKRGGIELVGAIQGFGPIKATTTNMAEAVKDADVIMVVVPAFAQMAVIEETIPFLESGQIVVFNPDNFASVAFKSLLSRKGVRKDIKIAGTESLLYATRRSKETVVDVWGKKNILSFSTLPIADKDYITTALQQMFHEFVPDSDVLTISLANVNMIIHCPTVVLNAGRIEDTHGDFEFYWQGMTESVCRVMEKMDHEKILVGKALGLNLSSALEYLLRLYPEEKGSSLHEFLTHSMVHGGRGPNSPSSMSHRYLVEDTANGLVPLSALGTLVKIKTPVVDSIIQLASVMNQTDYFSSGRTLSFLGLQGKTSEEIIRFVKEGY